MPPAIETDARAFRFYSEIQGILHDAQRMDIRTAEQNPIPATLQDLLTQVGALVDRCRGIAGEMLEQPSLRDPVASETAVNTLEVDRAFDFELDDLVSETSSSASQVESIAFLVNMELKERARLLQSVRVDGHAWESLSVCDSALRRAKKGARALGVALCEDHGLDNTFDFATELEVSLAVRSCYSSFAAHVSLWVEPADEELHRILRGAGTQIAILVGRDIYPSLRIQDRHQIRTLQGSILDWLRVADTARDASTGRRLLQDLSAFAQMLLQVSRRQELVEHDRRVLQHAQRSLTESPSLRTVPESVQSALLALKGLDRALDGLLESSSDSITEWRATVSRLASSLGVEATQDGTCAPEDS